MADEVWLYVEDYPDYVVSNLGNVLNLKYDRELKKSITDRGYVKVIIRHKVNTPKQFYVHQLVAQAFMGGWRRGVRVKHIDGDKQNNKLENLEIMGGESKPPTHYDSPRLHARRLRIVETGEVFRTAYDCANHIGGNASNIYRVLNGFRDSHRGYTFEYVDADTEIQNAQTQAASHN